MCVDGGYGDPDLRLHEVSPQETRRRWAAGHTFVIEITNCHIGQQPALALPHLRDLLGVHEGDAELVEAHFLTAGDEIQEWVKTELAKLQHQDPDLLVGRLFAS